MLNLNEFLFRKNLDLIYVVFNNHIVNIVPNVFNLHVDPGCVVYCTLLLNSEVKFTQIVNVYHYDKIKNNSGAMDAHYR